MSAPRFMPEQKPGRSVQDVATPTELILAVTLKFGRIEFDLAANAANAVCAFWYGPGSSYCDDAFLVPWHQRSGLLWLNPPYGEIAKWAERCAFEAAKGARIALLVPASVGSNWFADYIDGAARVFFLRPRITFAGHKQPYPKDCMLALYGETPGYECWRWR